jgi:iron-sulfur cluster repair protein YtfE (RIC family)
MEKKAPLKRHPALHHLSHDHHHGLLLCWKIRRGFKLGIDPIRIKVYCEWFWENHLQTHFEEEESLIFPILENDNQMLKQAMSEHKRLRKLFSTWENPERTLGQIEEELEKHIRFEERILFPVIQEKATYSQLEAIAAHTERKKFVENGKDPFWIKAT